MQKAGHLRGNFRENLMRVSKSSKLFIALLLVTLFCIVSKFFNEKANLATIYPGEPCDYYDRISDVEESDLSSNRCLFEGGDTGYELSSDVDGFVSQIVERDFPGYQRDESWVSIADTAYTLVNLKRIVSRPLAKAVWFCSSPETQPLTTNTSIFALCSASGNKQGTGYEATVSFYEFQQSKAGFASRRIYNEGAMVQEEGMTSVLFSVDFSL